MLYFVAIKTQRIIITTVNLKSKLLPTPQTTQLVASSIHNVRLHCLYFSGNLARGKDASQTGVWDNMFANRAVDGDLGPEREHCSHQVAATANDGAWWQVDLGDDYVIVEVTIVNGVRSTGMYA